MASTMRTIPMELEFTTPDYLSTTPDYLTTTAYYMSTTVIDYISTTPVPDQQDIRTWLFNIIMQRNAGVPGGFWQAFVASLSVVIVSELGDKTFFIAAIMAMKHPRLVVFAGAVSALVLMTVLSAAFGWIATVIPRVYTHYISVVLFVFFGLKMLYDAWRMDPNEGKDELEEVQSELAKRENQEGETFEMLEHGSSPKEQIKLKQNPKRSASIKIFIQAATLTFLAEWGDRSQLATVILATREDAVGVAVGGALGHALCTGLAVIGGRMLAQKISVRTVTIIGGIVFLIFAISALIMGPGE